MLAMFWILSILLITGADGLFVSVGNYPEHKYAGVNLPECGLGYLYTIVDTSFGTKCFYSGFPNITILKIYRRKMFERERRIVSNRILHGRNSLIGESPWTVRLVGDGSFSCTGVLITFEWVMTAAHCLNKMTIYALATAGSNERNPRRSGRGSETISVNLKKLFKHPFYDNPSDANLNQFDNLTKIGHDIGLVKLKKKFTALKNNGTHYLINTVCLPKNNQTNDSEEYAIQTGYGKVGPSRYPDHLQIGRTRLSPFNQCNILMFCANVSGDDVVGCSGDSGGPLVQEDHKDSYRAILVGIWAGSSNVPNCTLPRPGTGLWTVPTLHIPWILDTISQN